MARPRVIIVSADATIAVKLMASLNPKRYRVEHVHDASEGLLRSELVLAHAAVVHLPDASPEIVKRCGQAVQRGVALVLASAAGEVARAAQAVGARYLSVPFGVQDVKRVVFRAVSDAHALRSEEPQQGKSAVQVAATLSPRRVVLMIRAADAGEIMAAVLGSQLGVRCDIATSAAEALSELGVALSSRDGSQAHGYDCVIADPELLMSCEAGATLARKLARRGVPVVPLGIAADLDESSAGQLAWDILPQVRRALAARDRLSRAAGS